jgi:hypothetical protein
MSSIDVFGVQLIDEKVDFYLTCLYWRIWKSKLVKVHELYSDTVIVEHDYYHGMSIRVVYKGRPFGHRNTIYLKSYFLYQSPSSCNIHNINSTMPVVKLPLKYLYSSGDYKKNMHTMSF